MPAKKVEPMEKAASRIAIDDEGTPWKRSIKVVRHFRQPDWVGGIVDEQDCE